MQRRNFRPTPEPCEARITPTELVPIPPSSTVDAYPMGPIDDYTPPPPTEYESPIGAETIVGGFFEGLVDKVIDDFVDYILLIPEWP